MTQQDRPCDFRLSLCPTFDHIFAKNPSAVLFFSDTSEPEPLRCGAILCVPEQHTIMKLFSSRLMVLLSLGNVILLLDKVDGTIPRVLTSEPIPTHSGSLVETNELTQPLSFTIDGSKNDGHVDFNSRLSSSISKVIKSNEVKEGSAGPERARPDDLKLSDIPSLATRHSVSRPNSLGSVFELFESTPSSKGSNFPDTPSQEQLQMIEKIKNDGSYQGIRTRIFFEILNDPLLYKEGLPMEQYFRAWNALNLFAIDHKNFGESENVILTLLGSEVYHKKLHQLESGSSDFFTWIFALFEYHVIRHKSSDISEEIWTQVSSVSVGDFFVIQRYLRSRYPTSYGKVTDHLDKIFQNSGERSPVNHRAPLINLEIKHLDESLTKALTEVESDSNDNKPIIEAMAIVDQFETSAASWDDYDPALNKVLKEKCENLKTSLKLRFTRHFERVSTEPTKEEAEALESFLKSLYQQSPVTLKNIFSQMSHTERRAIQQTISQIKAHLDPKIPVQKLSTPMSIAEERRFPSTFLTNEKEMDQSVETNGPQVLHQVKNIFEAIGENEKNIQSLLDLIETHLVSILGLSQTSYERFNYISPYQALQFSSVLDGYKDVIPQVMPFIRSRLSGRLGNDECDRKFAVLIRSHFEGERIEKWRKYQEEAIKKLLESPEINEGFLHVLRLGSILKLHEHFPTFKDAPEDEWFRMEEAEVKVNKEMWKGVGEVLGVEQVNALKHRLRFVTQSGKSLNRWKNNEPKDWLCHDLDFEMLTEFTDYLQVGEKEYPSGKALKENLGPKRTRILGRLAKKNGKDRSDRWSARIPEHLDRSLKPWFHSIEEDWMRNALGDCKRDGIFWEYDHRVLILESTFAPWEHSGPVDYDRIISQTRVKPHRDFML
ncbi:hypothetical protein CROQUDRAFT_101151 [Cronartium quercuum f. sp. fusiforme G11]|uniref:Uncharacterized protein n=1 Tax=Cronartium quercuum f. sp. fusiforme G11 TaxID=708437 RepID=A0A9P6N8I3_9BASI|nr:hypothetical protein CROQUDRAFT_101151 [Cronartium quercuum f. sp. fusiforme G11]